MNTTCALCHHEIREAPACGFCGCPAPGREESLPPPPPTPASLELPPGTALDRGLYRVGAVLGQGGFGITYAGADMRLQRLVAIKELFPAPCARVGHEVRSTADFPEPIYQAIKARFLEEARVVARFQHPGIVHVHGFFEENATAYMVMEMVRGETLQGRVERLGPFAEELALACVRQVGEALQVVHAAGFLHRDLKPENMLLAEDGRVVLLDFGTARQYALRARRMTAMVTPGYAPPEQYSGQAQAAPTSDVYALAATLYHLLTGTVPAEAVERAQGSQVLIPLRTLAPGTSETTAQAVERALALDEQTRPASVCEFLAALQPAQEALASSSAATITVPLPAGGATTVRPLQAAATTAVPAPRRLEDLAPTVVARLEGHRGWIRALAFAPGGALLASAAEDRTIRLWNLRGEETACLSGHEAWVSALGFSADGRKLFSGSHDRTLRAWDVATGTCTRVFKARDRVCSLALPPGGGLLVAGLASGLIQLFPCDQAGTERSFRHGDASVVSLACAPDGSQVLVAASGDHGFSLVELGNGSNVGRFEGHQATVRSVTWFPAGVRALSGSADGTARAWDRQTQREVACLSGHRSPILAVACSPQHDLAASASQDHVVRLWQPSQGQELHALEAHKGEVSCVTFSPDGTLLATASQDQVVLLWQLWP